MTPEEIMKYAVALSRRNVSEGAGGPFAAVVAKEGTIIAEAVNSVTSENDPTAHAEVNVIRRACHALGTYQLTGCELYTTCEPCPMCLGAIYWARPEKIYYANTRNDAASIGFDDLFIYQELTNPIDRRKIPMIQIGREEAMTAFREWNAKSDKMKY
jgi:guanine deaminase